MAQRAKYDGVRFSVGAREQARGVQPLCWGALGYVATACASTCRKRKHSARRPVRRQARRGERRTAPRRANTDEDHRRAPTAVDGCGLDLSAGVRTAITSSPTSLHKNSTTRRPVHRFPRHGARARHTARRGVALGSRAQDAARGCVHKSVRHNSLGWLRCDGATRAARVVDRSWGNGGAPALGGSKACSQTWLREGNDAREGEATVLTAGRRCSRRRLDEDGGATWTYAAAPGSLLCFGVPS
jgi:hypothetical protein